MRKAASLSAVLCFAPEIMNSDSFLRMNEYRQHGNCSTLEHSINVACVSLRMAKYLHLSLDQSCLVRAALLHDYYLYDWHDKKKDHFWEMHGYLHPKIAAQNARRDYQISDKEFKIIKRHMFPLTPMPPTSIEGFMVMIADKYCAVMERFRRKIF